MDFKSTASTGFATPPAPTLLAARSRRCQCALLLAALSPLLLAHREAPLPPPVRPRLERRLIYVYEARNREQLRPGLRSKVEAGDLVIGNRMVRFAIGGLRDQTGFPDHTGYVLDAGRAGRTGDLLGLSTLFLQRGQQRVRARYRSVRIVRDGRDGVAAIEARGTAARWPRLELVTTYRLDAAEEYLRITTSVTNRGRRPVKLALGDYVRWTNSRTFFPGQGFRLLRRSGHRSTWVARRGAGSSFGWFVPHGRMSIRVVRRHQGSRYNTAMRVYGRWARLRPGTTVRYVRALAVGRGDVADVARIVYEARRQTARAVTGTIRVEGRDRLVPGARVWVYGRNGRLVSEAETDRKGYFTLHLRPGRYRLRAWEWGRPRGRLVPLRVGARDVSGVALELRRAAKVYLEIADARTGKLIPGRAIFVGLGHTRSPRFLPEREERHRRVNVVYTHTGRALRNLDPGHYQVVITRGPEYTIHRARIRVRSGQVASIFAKLERVLDTRGSLACDFHVHSVNSQDSLVGLEDRVRTLVAENIELVVGTDHNHVTDYRPVIRRMGLGRYIQALPGDEITTSGIRAGHFNAYPVEPEVGTPGEGAFSYYRRLPAEIFAEVRARPGPDRVIQVNHPRFPRKNGYFTQMHWNGAQATTRDRRYSPSYDALEIFNGLYQDLRRTRRVLREWFALLNRGYRYTGTGNSDSHMLGYEEVGYPRNFVLIRSDRPGRVKPAAVVEAVKAGRLVVSNGPFLRVTAVALGANGRPAPELEPVGRLRAPRKRPAAARPWYPRPPGAPARAAGGLGSLVRAGPGGVGFRVEVQAAPWVDARKLVLIGNGRAIETVRLRRGNGVRRYQGLIAARPRADTWYVLVVWGKKPLVTIPRRKIPPLAFSNPIWVDADLDGVFTPPVNGTARRRRRSRRRHRRLSRRRRRRSSRAGMTN